MIDEANQTMLAVDPADTDAILRAIEEEESNGFELLGSLTTHKHWLVSYLTVITSNGYC